MKFWNDENSWFNRTGMWLSTKPLIFAIVPAVLILFIGWVINFFGSLLDDLADD